MTAYYQAVRRFCPHNFRVGAETGRLLSAPYYRHWSAHLLVHTPPPPLLRRRGCRAPPVHKPSPSRVGDQATAATKSGGRLVTLHPQCQVLVCRRHGYAVDSPGHLTKRPAVSCQNNALGRPLGYRRQDTPLAPLSLNSTTCQKSKLEIND